MSAHTKKHPTKQKKSRKPEEILRMKHRNVEYMIPKQVAEQYRVRRKRAGSSFEELIPAETVFAELNQKHTKAGALLRGLRARECLTQVEFAECIGVTQANLSKMENGKRSIG